MYGVLKWEYGSVPLAVLIQQAFPYAQSQIDLALISNSSAVNGPVQRRSGKKARGI
jgi:hypothetical protein